MIQKKLKEIRKEQGLTLKQMDSITGIPYTMISDIESGKGNPTLETLNRLTKALNCHLDIQPNKK